MYIRRQKQRFQLIRTVYDPKIRKGRQQVLGSISAEAPSTDTLDIQRLTAEEQEQLTAFLIKHDQEAAPAQLKAFLSVMREFREYLARTNAPDALKESEEWAQVSQELEELASTMRSRHLPSSILRQMKLPGEYDQEIIRMREEGLSIRQIAAALSTTRGTVQHRIRKARAAAQEARQAA